MLMHLESAAKYFNKWGWIFDLDRGPPQTAHAARLMRGERSLDRPCGGKRVTAMMTTLHNLPRIVRQEHSLFPKSAS